MPELLSPAGNFEKLKAAILYGADAVYCAGQMFGMRASADNFTVEELYEAAEYVHARGKKIDLTVNTMPHVQEYPLLRKFLADVKGAGIDAMIVYYDSTVLLQKVCITQCLQLLKSNENVCLTFFYDGLCHLLAVTNKGNYTTATLCHTVHLRKLYIISCIYSDTT